MKRILLAIMLLAAPVLFAAEKPLAVASLSPVLTDLARNVGGNQVEVTGIVEPGIDPHEFEPTPGDIRRISQTKLVLASGFGMEGYLEKMEKNLGGGPKFIVIGNSLNPLMVKEDEDHAHHQDHGHGSGDKVPDPHWWHSIGNVKIAVNVLRDAFSEADPANKAAYSANASQYQKKLDALAKWAKLQVASLPGKKRVLVTSHDALGYFARDYGFVIHPVEGISTADQPSSRKVRAIIDAIKAQQVKAIFFESYSNPKVLTEITRESGAKIGGELYADGIGLNAGGTYEGMFKHNVDTIVSGLK